MRTNLDGLSPEQVIELAQAYLDLLNLMNEALMACETHWAYFAWNGRGYEVTGHPPQEVVDAIRRAAP